MNDKSKIKESGAAVKPGEPTAAKTMTLTAGGVADLLKSDFAAEQPVAAPAKPATPPAPEIPAAGDDGVEEPEKAKIEGEGEEGAEAPEPPEAEGEAVEQPETPEESPLPQDAQAALEAWEATGGPLPKALQSLVDKRIGKLTGARDAEKARADKAETELKRVAAEAEALRNDPNRPAHVTPSAVMDDAHLTKLATTAEKFLAEAENYLDDTATDEERGRVEKFMQSERLDANGLKRRIRETNTWLTRELPEAKRQVQAFKAQEAATEPVVKARFPWLDDKSRPEYATAQQVLGIMPELRQRTPAHRVAVGTYVLGMKVMDHLAKAGIQTDAGAAIDEALAKAFPVNGATAPKAKTPPPKAPVSGAAAPAARAAGTRTDEAARQKFNQRPTRESATELARAALMAA